MDDMTPDETFFYVHAAYSYGPDETPEQGKARCAREYAKAESDARDSDVSYQWDLDPDIDSREFYDGEPYRLWQCVAYDATENVVASLHGIDLGPDGTPHGTPYRRVVEAELATEALAELDKATMRNKDLPIGVRREAMKRHNRRTSGGPFTRYSG